MTPRREHYIHAIYEVGQECRDLAQKGVAEFFDHEYERMNVNLEATVAIFPPKFLMLPETPFFSFRSDYLAPFDNAERGHCTPKWISWPWLPPFATEKFDQQSHDPIGYRPIRVNGEKTYDPSYVYCK